MIHRSTLVLPALVLALTGVLGFSRAGAAAGSITGTVTATGMSSNADAVVYVQQATGTFTPGPATMDQKSMQFIPHVLPVVLGTTVKFVNSDPTPHNVFTPDFEKFNLGTWPQGQSKSHVFDKCAKTPCAYVLLCRVHPEMEGFVVVLQNPYFAVTNKAGHYAIEGVPAGQYSVAVWHPKLKLKGAVQTLTVGAGPVTADFTLAK
jgi:plastocyanin